MKLLVHWPPSTRTCTPGRMVATPSSAHSRGGPLAFPKVPLPSSKPSAPEPLPLPAPPAPPPPTGRMPEVLGRDDVRPVVDGSDDGSAEPCGSCWAMHPASKGATRRRPKARLHRILSFIGTLNREKVSGRGLETSSGQSSVMPGEPATLFSGL